MTIEDIDFFLEIRNECCSMLHNDVQFNIEQSKKWFMTSKPKFYIIIYDNKDIGYFRTSFWNIEQKFMSIGADIHKKYRGNGYMADVYKKFINEMYTQFNIDMFFLEVLSHNNIAKHLYEKIGFVVFSSRPHSIRNKKEIESISMVYKFI